MAIPQVDQPLIGRIEKEQGWLTTTWFRFFALLTDLSNTIQQFTGILPVANGGTGSNGSSVPWTPTDGSGAGLVFTINHAAYTQSGGAITLQADVTFPVTASGAFAQFNGVPISAVGRHPGSIWNNSATGATSCLLSTNVINFYSASGTPLTNANLSAAIVRIVVSYQTS